ncbi:hypothetical protein EAI_06238 [Harpegnathos saltator]|uniref:Uncharacterized protein n=1 Tax=Harpegnathos saltator TaxID=610380 RepID=E2C197_HARSA|nr:hypothetical protein EAI_06238 [Harpegnathos saltator]
MADSKRKRKAEEEEVTSETSGTGGSSQLSVTARVREEVTKFTMRINPRLTKNLEFNEDLPYSQARTEEWEERVEDELEKWDDEEIVEWIGKCKEDMEKMRGHARELHRSMAYLRLKLQDYKDAFKEWEETAKEREKERQDEREKGKKLREELESARKELATARKEREDYRCRLKECEGKLESITFLKEETWKMSREIRENHSH